MRPVSHACTLATIAGLVLIGAARATIAPPSWVKPVRAFYSRTEPIRFDVRIAPEPSLRLLRVELWICEMVSWTPALPARLLDGFDAFDPDVPQRCEPQAVKRGTDVELNNTTPNERAQQLRPKTIYRVEWWEVPPDTYELSAKVITNRGVSVKSTRPLVVH